jgi:hypothetical protein
MDMDVEIRNLRTKGREIEEIAELYGLDVADVEERLASAWRDPRFGGKAEPNEYLIMLEASAVRMHWSPEEESRRRGQRNGWTPPDASESIFAKPVASLRYRSA